MKKINIMIIERQENEIEFFKDSLEESGLDFFCTIARNIDQGLKMVESRLPDVVFIDVDVLKTDGLSNIKQFKSQGAPMVLFSAVDGIKTQHKLSDLSYVQLPKSIRTMANVLKNFFIDNSVAS